jgi:hypothetical protein
MSPMKLARSLRTAALAGLLCLTACFGGPQSGTLNANKVPVQSTPDLEARFSDTRTLPESDPQVQRDLPAGTGAVVVAVDWPSRTIQYIPSKTLRFDLFARLPGSQTVLASASIVFPNKTGVLKPLPQGTSSIEAWAMDADKGGKSLASGSVQVNILANDTVAADLELLAANPLQITSFSPLNGVTGDTLTVLVKGIVESSATAKLGGQNVSVTSVSVNASGDGSVGILVPASVATGYIELTTDAGTMFASNSILFTRIASLNISPLTKTTATGTVVNFTGIALALDRQGNPTSTVSNPVGMDFSAVNQTPYVAGQPPRTPSSITSTGSYTAAATGSDLVLFGRPGVFTATSSVTVQ